jgi:hypothetical protein
VRRRLLAWRSLCLAIAIAAASAIASACSSYGEEASAPPVSANSVPPTNDAGNNDSLAPDVIVTQDARPLACPKNFEFCEHFDDGTWRKAWIFRPLNAPIQEDGVNFVSQPFGVAFEVGTEPNALKFLERPIQRPATTRLTLSASLRIEKGTGDIDLLSLHGEPGGVLLNANGANGVGTEIGLQSIVGTSIRIRAINFTSFGAFAKVKLVVDLTAHSAALTINEETVTEALDDNWRPSSVRVGISYNSGPSTWKVQADDIQLMIE